MLFIFIWIVELYDVYVVYFFDGLNEIDIPPQYNGKKDLQNSTKSAVNEFEQSRVEIKFLK